jgi:Ca-activated chloride channel homolog
MSHSKNAHSLVLALLPLAICATLSVSRGAGRKQSKAEAPAQDVRKKIRVESNLVVLSVTVKDAAGHLVSGLGQDDFHVFDDDVEQTIAAFTDQGLPLSLVVLIDDDMKWKEGSAMARSLRGIAGSLSDTDEAMVCRYDMLFYAGNEFTNVEGSLIAALQKAQSAAQPSPPYIPEPLVTDRSSTSGPPPQSAPTYAGARPTKALDDAVYSAAQLLQSRAKDRRRIILLISDGANEPKLNHRTQSDVLELLLQSNISLYSLAVGSNRSKRRFIKIADYALQSGGGIFYANDTDAMTILYGRITEQARHDYTIAYAPAGNSKGSNYHTLKVATRAGLTATTRTGYYSAITESPRN